MTDNKIVKALWKWKCGSNWVGYDLKTCLELESLYNKGKTVYQLEINGQTYSLDLNLKTQINVKTKTVRPIKRSLEGYTYWKWIDNSRLHRFDPNVELELELIFKANESNRHKLFFMSSNLGLSSADVQTMQVNSLQRNKSYKMLRSSVEPYTEEENHISKNNSEIVSRNSHNNSQTEKVSDLRNKSSNTGNGLITTRYLSFCLNISNLFKTISKNDHRYPIATFLFKKMKISRQNVGNIIKEGVSHWLGQKSIVEQVNEWQIFEESTAQDDDCAICLAPMTDDVIKLSKCPHHFHSNCFTTYINQSQKAGIVCPKCNKILHKGNGPCPRGSMLWAIVSGLILDGHTECGTIVILYVIRSGIQSMRHPNPNKPFIGTMRAAYLPYNKDGIKVFKLLKKAFEQGHTFTVGYSVTTGKSDIVIWNGIHHKTSRSGGSLAYGYPDETYFERVLSELEQKGITPGDDESEEL